MRPARPHDKFKLGVGVWKDRKLAEKARFLESEDLPISLDTAAHIVDVQSNMGDTLEPRRLRRFPTHTTSVRLHVDSADRQIGRVGVDRERIACGDRLVS